MGHESVQLGKFRLFQRRNYSVFYANQDILLRMISRPVDQPTGKIVRLRHRI